MDVIGIDLSGPSSPERTAVALFEEMDDGLVLKTLENIADDSTIAAMIPSGPCVVGIDAPLSYSPSGGSRESDRRLRRQAVEAGLSSGSVMAPTAPRMAYLTLRGVSLTRHLEASFSSIRMAEVHPTVSLALRGAPMDAVRSFKGSPDARMVLAQWLQSNGLRNVGSSLVSDHAIAAFAAALAAWKWTKNESVWLHKAEPPIHPFDFAC